MRQQSSRYTILIVDDNQNNLFTLQALIEEHIHAAVILAKSGQDALHKVVKHPVDLIILDVQMDGMDGFEVAAMIKRRPKTQHIPIVFLTAAYIGEEFRRRGFEIGAADYLTKPIDEYQLMNRINIYLRIIEKERVMNRILEERVKQQTKELEEAKNLAETANEAKSTFLANITHELRTPINILLSTNDIIQSYLEDDKEVNIDNLKKKIKTQKQNCYRLLRLVNNLIDVTKIDSGFFELSLSKCNIVEVVENITLSVVEYASNKGIEIIFDTDVEEKCMCCDLDAIERIMLNLLSNAVKFTPQGGKIFVDVKDMEEDIQVSVKDTGIGIDHEQIDMVFERFKQANNVLTRRHEGSGIGLSLVKSLVEMHGGTIKVKSENEQGTEFIISLPTILAETCKKREEGENLSFSQMQKINVEFSDIYL